MLYALLHKRERRIDTLFVVLFMVVVMVAFPLSTNVSETLISLNKAEAIVLCTPGTSGEPENCSAWPSLAACETANGPGQCLTIAAASATTTSPSGNVRSVWDIGGRINDALLWLVNLVLAALIWVVGGMLALVGTGFDEAVNYTIVNFGTTFKNFEPGVNAAWAGFRDVANIVIIAMFVFIAFSVILNSQTYGLKQFGVRILLVAVLINFSLFFTKAIVDISNVTAIQFRNAIEVKDRDGKDAGIAAAFMNYSGLAGFGYTNAKATLDELRTDSEGNTTFGSPFLYTFLIVLFFGAMLTILLYGLILLVTRMVVLLVLMFTSAAAFAAYMIPKHGQKWWDKWWSALIQNALFAPVFMMMLWATLNIIQKTGANTSADQGSESAGTILAMVQDPEAGWAPVLNMFLVLGLLYASTKIASELSLVGAKFASTISSKGFSATLRAAGIGGALGLIGRGGRRTIGRAGAALSENPYLRRAASSNNIASRLAARGALAASKTAAGASFDLRDSATLAKGLKKAGITLGPGVGNYEAGIKKDATYLADSAKAQGEIDNLTRGQPVEAGPSSADQTRAQKELLEDQKTLVQEQIAANRLQHGKEGGPDQVRVTNVMAENAAGGGAEKDGGETTNEAIQSSGEKIERTAETTRQEAQERQQSDKVPTSDGGSQYLSDYRNREGRFKGKFIRGTLQQVEESERAPDQVRLAAGKARSWAQTTKDAPARLLGYVSSKPFKDKRPRLGIGTSRRERVADAAAKIVKGESEEVQKLKEMEKKLDAAQKALGKLEDKA